MRRSERRLTGPLGTKVFGSKAWSDGSLMGRESSVERKVLVKESSVIVVGWSLVATTDNQVR